MSTKRTWYEKDLYKVSLTLTFTMLLCVLHKYTCTAKLYISVASIKKHDSVTYFSMQYFIYVFL